MVLKLKYLRWGCCLAGANISELRGGPIEKGHKT